MKIGLIAAISILLNISLYSQRTKSEIDSILNSHDRRYRVTLGEDDHKFIKKQLVHIGSDCKELEKLLYSKNYSNNYKLALLNNFEDWTLCSKIILNSIDICEENEDTSSSMPILNRSLTDYPIFSKIVKNRETSSHFTKYLVESDFLNDCRFLLKNRSIQKLKMYSLLIENTETFRSRSDSCKLANLIILEGLKSN